MSEVLEVDLRDEAGALLAARAAAAILRAGELVVVPTETVYGIACRPDDPATTARLFEAKRRPRGLNLPVLAATAEEALALAEVPPEAAALAAELWPGPLTIVLRRSATSASWDLGDERETIGIRVPDLTVTRAVLGEMGPLGVTSANRSGEAPATDRAALLDAFGDTVSLYLVAAGERLAGAPSTVVDLTDAPRVEILRSGSLSRERIHAVLASSGRAPQWVDFPR